MVVECQVFQQLGLRQSLDIMVRIFYTYVRMTVRYHLRPHCHVSSDAYLVTFRNNIKYVGLKISIKKWLTSLEFEQTKYKVENESYYTLCTYIFGIFLWKSHRANYLRIYKNHGNY